MSNLSDKKICMIYTGGTIGMVATETGYAPKAGYLKRLLGEMPELQSGEMPQWDIIEFSPLLDSSNVAAAEWKKMARTIEENYDKYDGFVVLHGTDTMAYTASALSFMLEGLTKSVILTGSQIPIGRVRSDAKENIISSLILAAEGRVPEVCLYFGNKLLRGCRAAKVSSDELIAFDSPNLPPLATFDIDVRYHERLIRLENGPLRVAELRDDIPIAVLKIFPGIQFSLFEGIMTEQLKGLVLEAFGVGNLPSYDSSLLPAVRKAAQNGTVICVCTQCLRGAVRLGTYETSNSLRESGAVSGCDMTVEAAVTKLAYLLSQDLPADEVRRLMETDLRGELTPV